MLLKEKSKVGIAHKERKKYDALMPEKRLKTSQPQSQTPAFVPQPLKEEKRKPFSREKIVPKMTEQYDEEMKK